MKKSNQSKRARGSFVLRAIHFQNENFDEPLTVNFSYADKTQTLNKDQIDIIKQIKKYIDNENCEFCHDCNNNNNDSNYQSYYNYNCQTNNIYWNKLNYRESI